MSEYQYHEWQAIDRLLTRREQEAVDGLSSHIEVSPSRAVVMIFWSAWLKVIQAPGAHTALDAQRMAVND